MKTIIVPTDYSRHSEFALELAIEIAPKLNCNVLLIHVIDLPPLMNTLYMDSSALEDLNEEAKRRAGFKFQDIRKKYNSERFHTAVFQGKLIEVLQEIENEYDTRLIIMGTKGASGLKEVVVGSNTEKVARNLHTPVISVPEAVSASGIKKILVPTNGKDIKPGFFDGLKQMQQIFDAHIEVVFINTLHAFENEEELKQNLENFAVKAQLQNYEVAVHRAVTPEDGISDYISGHNINMVAITTHGRQGFSHLMYGSLAENLINHLNVPVYSYNLKSTKN